MLMASKNRPGAQDKDKKKDKDTQTKAEITVVLTDKQAERYLKSSKVITASELAHQTGVKISAANLYLKDAVQQGTIKRVGGYSGHWLYQRNS